MKAPQAYEARLDDILARHERAIPMLMGVFSGPASALSEDDWAAVQALARELDRLHGNQLAAPSLRLVIDNSRS